MTDGMKKRLKIKLKLMIAVLAFLATIQAAHLKHKSSISHAPLLLAQSLSETSI